MLVRTTRTISTFALRATFYASLFAVVVVAHLAITGALRQLGWGGGVALFVSGVVVLALVLVSTSVVERIRAWRAEQRELLRLKQKLPAGPVCVVWRAPERASNALEGEGDAMPWEVAGPVRARYPKLARRLGVEGVAIAEFEVNAEGKAKSIHCVYAWPSDVFYDAAREALEHAQFKPRGDVHVRFGASYKMPFVFRIAGATKVRDEGRRARTLRPTLEAAAQVLRNTDRR